MSNTVNIFKSNPDLLSTDTLSGSGQFSEVYLTPCGEYAIKHGNHGFADGWLLFAAKLLSMPEEERPWWAPVIHSLRVDMDTGRFTALLRAYEDVNFDEGPLTSGGVSDLMRVIEEGLPDLGEDEVYDDDDERNLLLEAEQFDNATVECVAFLNEIQIEADVPLYFDMPCNSMYDATTGHMVLNDPCCVMRWHRAKEDMRYREKFRNFLTLCAETAPDMQLKGPW